LDRFWWFDGKQLEEAKTTKNRKKSIKIEKSKFSTCLVLKKMV